MQTGKCPKCDNTEIYVNTCRVGAASRAKLPLSLMTEVAVDEFICAQCGFIESYLSDLRDMDKVKAKCQRA